MIRRWHGLLFLLALLLGAVWQLPLALVLGTGAVPGLSAARVSGTLWRGQLEQARWAGLDLGQVETRLVAPALLHGAVQLRLTATGGALQGTVDITRHGSVRAVQAQRLLLTRLPAGGGITLGGRSEVRDLTVRFADGRCAEAGGAVRSDALLDNALGGWRGPLLEGGFSCQGDQLALDVTGSQASDFVRLRWRVAADGTSTLSVRVSGEAPALAGLLPAAGFVPDPEAGDTSMRLERTARLW